MRAWVKPVLGEVFLSTSPLRGTTTCHAINPAAIPISIHVPLAGDDVGRNVQGGVHILDFYPRPPCGGRQAPDFDGLITPKFLSTSPLRGTTCSGAKPLARILFLSTSPLRGTTCPCTGQFARDQHFYPRPPCGGRHQRALDHFGERFISIHVPLAGDDVRLARRRWRNDKFLSTSPLRGTTDSLPSIHRSARFLSTSPLRGTTRGRGLSDAPQKFLSTSPLRGTT